ncbi:hypothetical protein [Pseudomonas sp.]|jgi:hypothetical protein|uniref:hypothetical protein n=1 Tax=Pseudomonas sp. TaxID=306 RepID=UPI0028B1E6AB|nr:hypothetical protein [Pseudomonas sp.]
MNPKPFVILLCTLLAALMTAAAPAAQAELSVLEQVQIYASRATSSLILLRGEGFQDMYRERLEQDIKALDTAMRRLPEPSSALLAEHRQLVTELHRGVAFGPREDAMPWGYPLELNKSLRDFLTAARAMPGAPRTEVAAKVEYLGVQYLNRAYLGAFEIAREQPENYLGQDERQLVPSIDAEIETLAARDPASMARLQTRWKFLRAALLDLNSQSNSLISVSGRPYAPTVVDRNTRSLSQQWMTMN